MRENIEHALALLCVSLWIAMIVTLLLEYFL